MIERRKFLKVHDEERRMKLKSDSKTFGDESLLPYFEELLEDESNNTDVAFRMPNTVSSIGTYTNNTEVTSSMNEKREKKDSRKPKPVEKPLRDSGVQLR